MRMAVLTWVVVFALIICVGCGMTAPEEIVAESGSVVAFVTDATRAPMAGVWVYVHDIPNRVGSTYSVGSPTNATGNVTLAAVGAGQRRVEVRPPSGYSGTDLTKTVDVVKGTPVSVSFTLRPLERP